MQKIIIKSADPSFRRAGLNFTRDGVVMTKAEWEALGADRQAAITNEPRLSIAPVKSDEDDEDDEPIVPAKKKK